MLPSSTGVVLSAGILGRWLHLFQLVEKQYQEQILAQQEQYQCQIQLIQDEIKALVQLQNRQGSGQPTPVNATLIPSDPSPPEDLTGACYPLTSPSPPPPDRASETSHSAVPGTKERLATVRSSGYGTLPVWESGLGQMLCPGDVHEDSPRKGKHPEWTCGLQEDLPEATGTVPQQSFPNEKTPGSGETCPLSSQQRTSSANQPLTSWAQRQKLRLKKGKAGQASPQLCEYYQEPLSPREPHRHTVALEQHQLTGLSSNSFPMRRSDSLLSEVSGLTYWRLNDNENEIYRPLPDSFDSGAYLLLQEVSMSLTPPQEPRLSLRQIYENKQKPEPKHTDWDGSGTSSPLSPQQALTLDAAVHVRRSERTSGVTSPSNVSSPSPHHLYPAPGTPGTPVSPDSVVECSANNPGDTDCSSNMSSFSAGVAPSPTKVQSSWAHLSQQATSRDKDQTPCSFTARASEEEGSLTSTLKLKSTSGASQHLERSSISGDPVALSLLRQNLREKHYRHVDDLRAYYESEIQTLREKLNLRDLPQDLEKSNQALRERCEHLERALAEAASYIQELEGKNVTLEKKLVEWPERYAVAVATVKSLQQRLEESKRSGAERQASAARLENRVRQLEEAAQAACREARDSEVRREREYKMLQDLLGEYDTLKKDHGGVKNSLVSAEDKLHRANDQILELKRVISKLESQVKQLEHENQARSRHHGTHRSTQPSGAGLFHHPDLLPSPSKHQAEADGLRSPRRLTDQSESGRRSPFTQTNQSNGCRRSPYLQCDQSAGSGGLVDSSGGGSNRRCSSPPDKLQSHPQEHGGGGGGLREAGRRDRSSNQTPMLRALIELEETRSTQSRAPWVGSQRTTVGLVERKHKEPIQEQPAATVGADAYVDELVRGSAGPERGAARTVRCHHDGPERASAAPLRPQRSLSPDRASAQAALLRPQRSLSPEGHRSSSLPPHPHSLPPATPTKRDTLLMPLSAKSSPKRCPTENYSTALGQLPRQQHLQKRLDVPLDQRRHSFHSASPRKRLHFTASSRDEDLLQSCSISADFSGSVNPTDTNSQLGWDEQRAAHQGAAQGSGRELLDSCEELHLPARLHSLADAERLLDELTQEKLQIEAALSRIPGAGSRVSLQTRLDEVALENRLERVNRELGSIRMTLKRFHVLRSSANV